MNNAHYTAYTEFGIPGASPVAILCELIPEKELFPHRPGTDWQEHHAVGAWLGAPWLVHDLLRA